MKICFPVESDKGLEIYNLNIESISIISIL